LPVECVIVTDATGGLYVVYSGPSPWIADPAFTHTSAMSCPAGAVIVTDVCSPDTST
jgi:hypothetical protein